MLLQEKSKFSKFMKTVTPARIIIFSFLVLIFIGTILLALPVASKGEPLSFINAFYVSTTAACVTGLSICDTYQTFTVFGQAVLLCMTQIGCLGFATFATAFTLLFRRKLGLRNLLIFSESAGSDHLNLMSLLRMIITLTFVTEIVGALVLMIRFVPLYGNNGIWISFFMSISAYCNAGFDILGFIPGNASVSSFSADPLVCITLALLVFLGGLGFVVVEEIWAYKIVGRFSKKKNLRLSFHSRVCLSISAFLVLLGTAIFFVFEYNNTMKYMGFFEKLLNAFFQSVNTRTVGFSTVNIAAENDITKLFTIILMFIGGSPGSTAGGIKVTTFIIMVAAVMSTLRNREDAVFMGHRFSKKLVYKCFTTTICAILLIMLDACLLFYLGAPGETIDIIFEVVAAFSTAGATTGITAELGVIGKLIMMITMFIGRVGPISFGIAIMTKASRKSEPILPEGRMLIG